LLVIFFGIVECSTWLHFPKQADKYDETTTARTRKLVVLGNVIGQAYRITSKGLAFAKLARYFDKPNQLYVSCNRCYYEIKRGEFGTFDFRYAPTNGIERDAVHHIEEGDEITLKLGRPPQHYGLPPDITYGEQEVALFRWTVGSLNQNRTA